MEWPNRQVARHHASPASGYDLGCSARPGGPITLIMSREGLRVERHPVVAGGRACL